MLRTGLLAIALCLFAATAVADGPTFQIAHQGRLLDGNDQPVDATVHLTFGIYDVSATPDGSQRVPPLWSAAYDVTVVHGLYALELGDVSTGQPALPASLFDGTKALWLGVAVGTDPELKPRLPVSSTAFAAYARDAGSLGGHPATDYALKTDVPAIAADSHKLGGLDPSQYALAADVDGRFGALASPDGTVNAPGNPVHWSQLAGVPDSIKNGAITEVATSAPLAGTGTASDPIVVLNGAIGATKLASDRQSLAAVSGGLLTAGADRITSTTSLELASGARFIGDGSGLVNLNDTTKLATAGGTLSGDLSFSGGAKITGLPAPSADTDAATKSYVDNAVAAIPLTPTVVTLADAATLTLDGSKGSVFSVTLGGNRAFANPTNLVNGQLYTLRIYQDATGGRTATFGPRFQFANGAPALNATGGGSTVLLFASDGTNLVHLGTGATAGSHTQVFTYSGAAVPWTVPAAVTSITVKAWGAGGGHGGAAGGFATGTVSVTPGAQYAVVVGGGGGNGTASAAGAGGFGGGGTGGASGCACFSGGGGGGGYSALFKGTVAQANTVLLAGGGGGAAAFEGGVGGGTSGGSATTDGICWNQQGAGGGTQTTGGGGATPRTGTGYANGGTGSALQGGIGGTGPQWGGGGGGGGYYGGGGGGGDNGYNSCNFGGPGTGGTGGGGGASYIANASVTNGSTQSGTASGPAATTDSDYQVGIGKGGATTGGNGLVVISW